MTADNRQVLVTGGVQPGFEKVAQLFQQELARNPGGGAVCVYHQGKPVVDLWGGVRDRAGTPWAQDTLSVSFSTSKGVAATLLHQLVAAGDVQYDKPVRHYWPEFAARGKGNITVEDLLTHRAGMHNIRDLGLHFDDLHDWDTVTRKLAGAPAEPRDNHSIYHALTFGWLVGEIIRRVTGEPFAERVQSALATPLNADGLFIGVPSAEHHRVADLLMGRAPDAPRRKPGAGKRAQKALQRELFRNISRLARVGLAPDFSAFEKSVAVPGFNAARLTEPRQLSAAMPAFNGAFTARSLARLYAALANDGELDGQRILAPGIAASLGEQKVSTLDRSLYTPMRWRLGYHQPFVLRRRRPRQAFGHFGFGGSGAWADPARKLSVALTVNAGTGTPWGDMRILRIGAAALDAAEKQRPA
jgi:CubicO group peptidase (beta-lactamase class C family)